MNDKLLKLRTIFADDNSEFAKITRFVQNLANDYSLLKRF
jgi:hypothetical protein